ncbi:MAG TPA: DUF2817 domain-containing protein, partial [Rhizomicrobium sp.]|nr:DUF2817 domain-containing protein [Rhizomicrobium sp.]
MPPTSESPGTEGPKPQKDYRAARRAFIAACEAAGVDTVARLHPAKGPDGKPLFMDCAALGPRRAPKAMLVVAEDGAGSAIQIELLRGEIALPLGAKLVLIGDVDQLPSVGPGQVLADLIASGIAPVVRLTQLYRRTPRSLITVNAHRVR